MNTEERKQADAKFEAAIGEYMATRGEDDGLLMDWVLVTANHIDDGGERTMTALGLYTPITQAVYRSMGLAEYASTKFKNVAGG